jgi:hypothetical protein
MADADSRKAMIKQATFQVRSGGVFIRRAVTTNTTVSPKATTPKPSATPRNRP